MTGKSKLPAVLDSVGWNRVGTQGSQGQENEVEQKRLGHKSLSSVNSPFIHAQEKIF